MATKSEGKSAKNDDDRIWFIITYVVPVLTGILTLIVKGEQNQRLKLHAFQSIILGIVMIVVAVIFNVVFFLGLGFLVFLGSLINLLLWIYGLYVGFEGYNGRDVVIPTITEYARRYAGTPKGSKK
jgi:uncharacterized membrane protein